MSRTLFHNYLTLKDSSPRTSSFNSLCMLRFFRDEHHENFVLASHIMSFAELHVRKATLSNGGDKFVDHNQIICKPKNTRIGANSAIPDVVYTRREILFGTIRGKWLNCPGSLNLPSSSRTYPRGNPRKRSAIDVDGGFRFRKRDDCNIPRRQWNV